MEIWIGAIFIILAAVAGSLLTWKLKDRDSNKWRIIRQCNIPLWVITSVYHSWFDAGKDKTPLFGKIFKGFYYEYKVTSNNHTLNEPRIQVKHLVVERRIQKGKE